MILCCDVCTLPHLVEPPRCVRADRPIDRSIKDIRMCIECFLFMLVVVRHLHGMTVPVS